MKKNNAKSGNEQKEANATVLVGYHGIKSGYDKPGRYTKHE